ncbi:hypothetical protein HJFPF1_06994 [Paramyrothecium foliicola]|nr:hypothetical protein HJFPF1_06994 [Paramyrothecium foliicola]
MALRRPLWPKPGLDRLAPPAIELRDPLRATRPAVGRRRFASVSTGTTSRFTTPPILPDPPAVVRSRFSDNTHAALCPELDRLLRSIRRKNVAEIYASFQAWVTLLQNSFPTDAVVEEAEGLSTPVFSEIVRSLDPFIIADQDVGGGLRISPGGSQFTSAAYLLDEYGIRLRNRMVVLGMQTLMFIRMRSPHSLLPGDYEVFMRCAGTAMDYQAVKQFWATMARRGDADKRTIKTWTEFVKGRFFTEPLYYQNDRTRVAQLARSMYRESIPMPPDQLRRLDNMRLSLNALKLEPWNRLPDDPEKDITRMLRKRDGHSSYLRHWVRADYYGFVMNEELLCTSIIAFARSSSVHAIHTLIFRNFYKIDIVKDPENPGYFLISGGIDINPSSPAKPTVRILDAIVEAFGSMSHIAQALNLLTFMSKRYNIPIPPQTWSNLLQWTYLCSSRPYQTMRRIQNAKTAAVVTADHVREIWKMMTSKPYKVNPTFDDYDCYIKTLILRNQIDTALDLIQEFGLPHYREAVQQYEEAILDELLRNDVAGLDPAGAAAAAHKREKAGVRRNHIRHAMSKWFAALLKSASKNRRYREGQFARVFIPDLLREFGDEFFYETIKYRTAHGIVTLERPDAPRRVDGSYELRQTLPQHLASFYLNKSEATKNTEDSTKKERKFLFEDYDALDFSEAPVSQLPLDESLDEELLADDLSVRDQPGGEASVEEPSRTWPLVRTMNVVQWRRRPRRSDSALGSAPRSTTPEGAQWWEKLEDRFIL